MTGLVTQFARYTVRTAIRTQKTEIRRIVSQKSSNSFARHVHTSQALEKAERKYTNKHEWVELNGKIGVVGISNYAQDSLGDVVYAQLPDVGSFIKKEDECGALESVKAASEIISPVSGKVIEKNEAVENKPSLINSSCYEDGWLFKIELDNPEELQSLMDENSYNEFLKSDPH
ncbi:glycine cleavage system H protein, mitochondrial [Leptopilina boulardi]|uniref:glycine cleavage system H protein, mitochondrial n=1 Tax=Leptopilina boulardi TaxID=63433 RepID=UPI0021F5A8A3|nr:glycine cleavage system H protein, mitochondrial [Leptopilina boulardi]